MRLLYQTRLTGWVDWREFLAHVGIYSITGFTENFEEPRTKEMLEQTLLEIAEEMEVLDYIDSPWSKLALLWGNGIVRTLKRKPINYTNHVADLEPDEY